MVALGERAGFCVLEGVSDAILELVVELGAAEPRGCGRAAEYHARLPMASDEKRKCFMICRSSISDQQMGNEYTIEGNLNGQYY